jgi:uroporphyrinogen-III synthase
VPESGEKHPLEGRTVLVTRRKEDAERWACELRALGAAAISYPMIQTRRVMDRLPDLSAYDGLVLTSPTAARYLIELLEGLMPPDMLKIVAVGKETAAALKSIGVQALVPPSAHGAKELAVWLPEFFEKEDLVLYLSARVTAADLRKLVLPSGIVMHRETLYETLPTDPDSLPGIDGRKIDYVVFSSPSTVNNFFKIHKLLPTDARAVSIGRTTAAALRKAGIRDVLTARKPDIKEIVEVMK